jgi:hypothetical protein
MTTASTQPKKRVTVWTDPEGCSGCDHCGMDMDMEPYCVHPNVVKEHPHGLNISPALARFCHHELWTPRKPR